MTDPTRVRMLIRATLLNIGTATAELFHEASTRVVVAHASRLLACRAPARVAPTVAAARLAEASR